MAPTFTVDTRPFRRDFWGKQMVVISKEPSERDLPDGSKAISIGFPVAVLTGWVGDGEEVAKLIADLLTERYAKSEAS